MTDHLERYRRELKKKLAYQYWERRGRPLGSPQIDWFFSGTGYRSVPAGFWTGISDSRNSSRTK